MKQKINITPDKSLIQKLGLTGYKTEQAIAELVDNSIDARFLNKVEEIDVILDFENNVIKVNDNGIGMDLEGLKYAFTIAKSTKTDETKLGKFGLGMKSACSTLGKSFTITTTKSDSKFEYVARYDEDAWLKDNSFDWRNFEVEKIKKLHKWNGTRILISKLQIPLYANQISRFKNNYDVRYGSYLKNKQICLRINTRLCESKVSIIQKDSKKNIDITLSNDNHITGWIGLLEKRSIKGNYGIHLFKNGRLINAFEKFGFSTHPEHAKIIGELHLDHVPVNFHKTRFIEDSLEYEEARHNFKNNSIVKETLKNANSQMTLISSLKPIFEQLSGNLKDELLEKKISSTNAKELLREAKHFTLYDKNQRFDISFIDGKNDGELYLIDDSSNPPAVIINRDNQAFNSMKNPIFLIALICIEVKTLFNNENTHNKFLYERNKQWTQFLTQWSSREFSQRPKKTLEIDSKYTVSNDLIPIIDYLTDNFEHAFQFTGLSTLYSFLQNAYGKIIYHLYAVKGTGQQLENLLRNSVHTKNFVILLNPNMKDIQNIMDHSEKNKFIVIREYAEKLSTHWAIPEKAWLDLYSESKKNLLPIPSDEIYIILDNLLERNLIDVGKLKSLAKHRHQLDEISKILENDN